MARPPAADLREAGNGRCLPGAGCRGGAADEHNQVGVGFGNIDAVAYASHYHALDPFVPILQRLVPTRVYSHEELLPRETFERSAFYREFMQASGEDPGLLSLVRGGAPRDRVSLIVTTQAGRGSTRLQVEGLSLLARHVTRALQLGDERQVLRAQRDAISGIRENAAGAVLLVDRSGRVLDASSNLEAVLAAIGGVRLTGGHLSIGDESQAAAYRQAVRACADVAASDRARRPQHIPLRRASRRNSEIVVHPTERDRTGFGSHPKSCVVVIDGGADPLWGWHAFQARYRLSPSEAALVELLARGHSLRSASEQRVITFETARTYLKRIFAKTGARRQSELFALVQPSLRS